MLLIRLHNVAYSTINSRLETITDDVHSQTQLDPLFPDLAVGNFSLCAFGNFQMKFMLQICLHLLGQVEMKLGLPKGKRVSSCTNPKQGILDTALSSQSLKEALREILSECSVQTAIKETVAQIGWKLRGMIDV